MTRYCTCQPSAARGIWPRSSTARPQTEINSCQNVSLRLFIYLPASPPKKHAQTSSSHQQRGYRGFRDRAGYPRHEGRDPSEATGVTIIGICIAICGSDEGDHAFQIGLRANRNKHTATAVARRHAALKRQRRCVSETVVRCRVGVVKIAAQHQGWIAEVSINDVLHCPFLVIEGFPAGQARPREAESDKCSG